MTNTWGFVYLLNGVRSVLQLNVPSFNLSTIWYIYTFYVPLVLVSHLMIFWILIRSKSWDQSALGRLFPVKWTTKMTDAIVIEDAGERGIIESIAGGKPKPVGFIVNCPVVYRIN